MTDQNNRTLSMLHIIPFESEIGAIAYIYGVATDPTARKQGYASKLITAALEKIREDNRYVAVALIPSDESTAIFYTKFGFERGCNLRFTTYNNFDFGSGDPSTDISMIYPIYKKITLHLPEVLTLTQQL